ncbi:MAG: hypothetical protein KDK65_00830 [Chlamydiia bacterium]|nr:hypothetical protein [Chlamydiia bacterium]
MLKIFIGCELTSLVRSQLRRSKTWQQEKIGSASGLTKTHLNKSEYIGFAATSETLADIITQCQQLEEQILVYCPDLKKGQIRVVCFPQLLVS